jgi:hypothetical protein
MRPDLTPDNHPERLKLRFVDLLVHQEIIRSTGFNKVI